MTAFLVLAGLGIAIVVLSLLFGDVLDGIFDFDAFDIADGILSTPVLGAFLTAFGFVGYLLSRPDAKLSLMAAVAGGIGAGVVFGGITAGVVRSMMNMPTDATPRTSDLVGTLGTVVTRIPQGGFGEVAVTSAGQRLKVNASADEPIASGQSVVIVEVSSATSVVVTEAGF